MSAPSEPNVYKGWETYHGVKSFKYVTNSSEILFKRPEDVRCINQLCSIQNIKVTIGKAIQDADSLKLYTLPKSVLQPSGDNDCNVAFELVDVLRFCGRKKLYINSIKPESMHPLNAEHLLKTACVRVIKKLKVGCLTEWMAECRQFIITTKPMKPETYEKGVIKKPGWYHQISTTLISLKGVQILIKMLMVENNIMPKSDGSHFFPTTFENFFAWVANLENWNQNTGWYKHCDVEKSTWMVNLSTKLLKDIHDFPNWQKLDLKVIDEVYARKKKENYVTFITQVTSISVDFAYEGTLTDYFRDIEEGKIDTSVYSDLEAPNVLVASNRISVTRQDTEPKGEYDNEDTNALVIGSSTNCTQAKHPTAGKQLAIDKEPKRVLQDIPPQSGSKRKSNTDHVNTTQKRFRIEPTGVAMRGSTMNSTLTNKKIPLQKESPILAKVVLDTEHLNCMLKSWDTLEEDSTEMKLVKADILKTIVEKEYEFRVTICNLLTHNLPIDDTITNDAAELSKK